jgi:hypothetical protein
MESCRAETVELAMVASGVNLASKIISIKAVMIPATA